MHIRFALVALSTLLLSGAMLAQADYDGYPQERVRLIRGDNHFPDELYTLNRVIFRNTEVRRTSRGMQISGSVITDFDADRVPAGTETPTGQLTGVKVNIELYSYDMVLERDPRNNNKLVDPKIDPKTEGNLVAGQMMTVTADETFGRYGMARFTLPELEKPLAPGLYRLVARVRLKSQTAGIREAFKWCSDMYGQRAVLDEDTMENTFHDVMADTSLHNEVYSDLMDNIGELKDVSLLWIGSILKDGQLELIAPSDSTERKPANYLIWHYHLVVIGQLVDYEYQLDNVDKIVDAELESKLKLDASDEVKARWKKEAGEDKVRIRIQNAELIAQNGGRTSSAERKLYSSSLVVKTAVMEQVARFQEYLTQRYWCLTDGWLQYAGWHTINAPGYSIWEAVTDKDHDNLKGRVARMKKLEDARNADGGLNALWEKRKEDWKYYPAETKKLVFDYLRKKEESPDWDADKFTEKDGNLIVMDAGKWAEYRTDFIVDFTEVTDKILAQVTTTELYAVQVWPKALATAIAAREDVLALTYSWEYYIRVDILKEEKDKVNEAWKREDQSMPTMDLAKYFKRGSTAPGTLKARFDSNLLQIKSAVKLGDFVATYRRAIDLGVKEKDLPGTRPPGAPGNE